MLLGDEATLRARAESLGVTLQGVEFRSPDAEAQARYVKTLLGLRGRRGMTRYDAEELVRNHGSTVGLLMLRQGEADGAVLGLRQSYPETIRMALQLIGLAPGVRAAAGVHVMISPRGPLFFADTTVNIDPDATMLADIAQQAARFAQELGVEPHVAMLSFANFGASRHPEAVKVAEATRLVRERDPKLDIEGEMQAQIALDPASRHNLWPNVGLRGEANVFVFPNLSASNVAYQMLSRLGGVDEIGPILLGLKRPATVIPPGCGVETIVQMTAVTALHAQRGGD